MSQDLDEYARDELGVAALFWEAGAFEEHVRAWMPANRERLQQLLWGAPGDTATPHLRPGTNGMTPRQIQAARHRVPEDLTADAIIDAFPGAYLAPPWRGFAHKEAAFRDWHIVSHRVSQQPELTRTLRALVERGTVDWAYVVTATGQRAHTHALVSFRFGRRAEVVRVGLGLDIAAKLSPAHGSFRAAVDYLDNQATARTELGVRPDRPIYRSGNRAVLERRKALEAIRTGEVTTVLDFEPDPVTGVFAEALRGWVENAEREPRPRQRVVAAGSPAQARATAMEISDEYSGRVFELDYRSLLQMYARAPPPRWFGVEVVLLLGVPEGMLQAQLAADWLRAVPAVVYTTRPGGFPVTATPRKSSQPERTLGSLVTGSSNQTQAQTQTQTNTTASE